MQNYSIKHFKTSTDLGGKKSIQRLKQLAAEKNCKRNSTLSPKLLETDNNISETSYQILTLKLPKSISNVLNDDH